MKLKALLERIKNLGGRRTKIRQAVLSFFIEEGELVSSAKILEALKKKKVAADRTTIYRELEYLKENAIIRELSFIGRPSLYELADDHHHHLVCLECNAVKPVKLDETLETQEKIISKKEKFTIKSHTLEFYGLCQKCR